MGNIIDNTNPKHNPITTILGGLFLLISASMFVVKYILPAFIVLKQEVPYEYWAPLIPLVIGLVLIFITDEYFGRIFNRVDKVAAKKTDTND